MKLNKLFAGIFTGLFICSAVFAEESSVEDEYMSSIRDIVITELANSPDRENKMVALQQIQEAIDDGESSPEIVNALDGLAGEGINTQSRMNGRMTNNFPDIRAKACEILGKVGTEDAAVALNKVVKTDNEPMVLSAAVRSLGDIGYNENDQISDTIAFISNRVEVLTPSSSLAYDIIKAYEKLMPNIKNKKPVIESLGRIATDYNYPKVVREQAYKLLKEMKASDASSKKSN